MRIHGIALKVVILSAVIAVFPLLAQEVEPKPTCNHCSAVYVPKSELDGYNQRAIEHKLVDQQVRSVDVVKVQVGIGSIYRGKLGQAVGLENTVAEAVAEHEQVSEVYYVIEGRGQIRVGDEDRPVKAGSLVFAATGVEHRFHDIEADLRVLVFWAPPHRKAEA